MELLTKAFEEPRATFLAGTVAVVAVSEVLQQPCHKNKYVSDASQALHQIYILFKAQSTGTLKKKN